MLPKYVSAVRELPIEALVFVILITGSRFQPASTATVGGVSPASCVTTAVLIGVKSVVVTQYALPDSIVVNAPESESPLLVAVIQAPLS